MPDRIYAIVTDEQRHAPLIGMDAPSDEIALATVEKACELIRSPLELWEGSRFVARLEPLGLGRSALEQ
jgi:hypothetical protein